MEQLQPETIISCVAGHQITLQQVGNVINLSIMYTTYQQPATPTTPTTAQHPLEVELFSDEEHTVIRVN